MDNPHALGSQSHRPDRSAVQSPAAMQVASSRAALAPAPLAARPFSARQQAPAGRAAALARRTGRHRRGPHPVAGGGRCGGGAWLGAAPAAAPPALHTAARCRRAPAAEARLEGVNKPELLPKGEFTPVIDVAGFLTDGEVRAALVGFGRLQGALFDVLTMR